MAVGYGSQSAHDIPIVMQNVAECGTIELIPVEASTMLGRIALQVVEAVFALAVYFLPAIIADRRKRHDLLTIALFNACIGWTLFGWLLALYWAFQPNPPPEIARDITVKRRVLRMSAFSTALIARIERRAAKRDGARR